MKIIKIIFLTAISITYLYFIFEKTSFSFWDSESLHFLFLIIFLYFAFFQKDKIEYAINTVYAVRNNVSMEDAEKVLKNSAIKIPKKVWISIFIFLFLIWILVYIKYRT